MQERFSPPLYHSRPTFLQLPDPARLGSATHRREYWAGMCGGLPKSPPPEACRYSEPITCQACVWGLERGGWARYFPFNGASRHSARCGPFQI